MGTLSRRTALSALVAGVAGAGVLGAFGLARRPAGATAVAARRARKHPVLAENIRSGSDAWQIDGKLAADDVVMGVKGYASHTSIAPGEKLSFQVTVAERGNFGIDVYRVGAYGGAGARLVTSSPTLRGVRQPAPVVDARTGLISCPWEPAWVLAVPEDWISGYYLAVFTTESGWRAYTPFVVRDGRPADLCVVVPFTTYQAYNQWPFDGAVGRSLYYGYDVAARKAGSAKAPLAYAQRARKVGFDRPYDKTGMPKLAELDQAFARWAEGEGYDVTYAASDDLHAGRISPARYKGLVFSGHDEYWTPEMRSHAERAVAGGTGLAFLSANNAYWRMRYEPSEDGTENRVIACYKSDPDTSVPGPGAATLRWRDGGPNQPQPEQELLGVMFNGIVNAPAPLVVRDSGHWLWQGTDVRDGDRIPGVVRGEADGFDPAHPAAAGDLALLSASPYERRSDRATVIQNTGVLTSASGATVFAAGSLTWSRGLWEPGLVDHRLRRATANVLDRIIGH